MTRTADATHVLIGAMTERELHRAVVDMARWLGLAVQDHGIRVYSSAGLNDLTIVGPGGCLFVELKRQDGRLTPAQQDWRATLLAAGLRHAIWRPADWLDGTIEAALRQLAATP